MRPSDRNRRGAAPRPVASAPAADRNPPAAGAERPAEASSRVTRRAAGRGTCSLGGVAIHLRQTRGLPEATREDEIACARTARGARNRSDDSPLQCGRCTVGQCRLLEGALRLVVPLAKRYRGLGLPLDDLIQEGNLGLTYALRAFDPDLGRFPSHAARWIRQTIHRAIDQQALVPASLRKLEAQRLRDKQEAEVRRGGEPVAASARGPASGKPASGKPSKKEPERVPDRRSFVSLDASPRPGGSPYRALLRDLAPSSDPAHLLETKEYEGILRAVVADLPAPLREVLSRNLGLGDAEPETLAAIGRSLDFSRAWAHRLRQQAIERMRQDPRIVRLSS